MTMARNAAVQAFRSVARVWRPRGMHRLATYLYDPYRRDDDYREDVVAYEGGLMQIDTRSFIEWWVYMFGSFEGSAVEMLGRLVDRESVVLDVGANVGVFTLPLARASREVHAFEPHPRLHERLNENLALNNIRNVVANDVALSDRSGTVTLFGAGHANQSQASLFQRDDLTESITCRQLTLDQYVDESGITRLDLVKIDVEGAEHRVLLGAKTTLERYKPAIYVEVNAAHLARSDTSSRELGEFLEAMGYLLWENRAVERRHSGATSKLSRVAQAWPTDTSDHYWLAVHHGGSASP